MSGSALAAIDAGQSVNVSTLGGSSTLNGGTVVIDSSKSFGTDFSLNDISGNTIDLKGATATLSGKFTGTGAITFTNTVPGTGVLTLTNNSTTYTGATIITSGTTVALDDDATLATSSGLTVNGTFDISASNSGATIISLSGTGNIVLGSLPLYVSSGVAGANFSGVISGTGSFALMAGTETLSGVNTYTGATTVSAGTLSLVGSGSIATSASVVVYGTLDASAVTATSTTFQSLSGSGTVTLGAKDLILSAASGSFIGNITTTGKLVLNGGTEYIGGAINTITKGIVINAGTLELGGATSDVTVNYNIVNNGTTATPGVLAFYNTYATTMNGVVSGTGEVDKWGSGIATMTAAQTYTGATVISGGTLKLTGAGSIASSKSVEVDAIFDLTESTNAAVTSLSGIGIVRLGTQSLTVTAGAADFSGSITGTGTLTISGGSQSLSGASTYTGATTVSGGKLVLVAGASLKSAVALTGGGLDLAAGLTAPGNVTINSMSGSGDVSLGANTLVLAAANDSYTGVISGSGNLWVAGGTETLLGNSTYTGTTTVAAGTLILKGSLASTSKLNISGTLDATGTTSPLTFVSLAGSGSVLLGSNALTLNTATGVSTAFSGVISGSGGLFINGAGTQILSGANTYSGGTIVGSGTMLQIGNGNNTGSIVGGVTLSTATSTLRFYRLDATTFTGKITGAGAVIQGGIGTTILTAENDYTGGTTITAGTLQIGDYDSAKAGTGLTGSIYGNVADNGTLAFARADAVTINATVSGVGSLAIKSGAITLTGASTYTGNTRIDSGATLGLSGIGAIAGSYQVTDNGTFDISATAAGTSIKSLAGTGTVNLGAQTLTLTAARDTFAGVISGSGGLILTGGSETLSGVSTYTGTTTLNAGTLNVTGSIANSAVVVNSGAILTGSGTVGALTVAGTGTVQGTLGKTLTASAVSLASTATYNVAMTSANSPSTVLAATGPVALNGAALKVSSLDGTFDLGNKIKILSTSGTITGAFTAPATFVGSAVGGNNNAVFKTALDTTTSGSVYLTVALSQLSPALATTATVNQKNVVAGIDKALATSATVPSAFQNLGNDTADVLATDATELSGEIGADTGAAAGALFTPFLDAMSDRTAMLRPLGRGQTRPLETWISAYGSTDVIKGDEGTGTHKFHSSADGIVAGAQWAPWPNTLIGGAISAGRSDFHIADNLGKGSATSIEAGVYGYVQTSRHIYNSFAAAVSGTQIKTSRVITVSGTDTLTSKLTAYTFGGRYEAGIQLRLFTPYIGVQDHVSMLPGYTEGAATGASTFALKYDSRTSNSGRAEVGIRHYIDVDVTPRWILSPDFTLHINDRLAYAYDISDEAQSGAMFAQLPSSDFSALGAKQGRHTGLASIGADVMFTNGLRVTTSLDAAISQKSQSFTGFATVGYTW